MDPPIPVPDVAGADATTRGLPRRVDLTLRQRLIVDSSAAADIGLRTAIASLLAATMLPTMLGGLRRGQSQAEQEQLRFYAELAKARGIRRGHSRHRRRRAAGIVARRPIRSPNGWPKAACTTSGSKQL